MKHIWFTIVILGSLLLGLSACVASETEAAEETAVPTTVETVVESTELPPTVTAEVVESESCIAENGRVFHSEEGNYCFVYPEDYCWLPGQDAMTNTFVSVNSDDAATNHCPDEPLILHGEVVWAAIYVEPINGQTLDELTAEFIKGLEDFGLELEEVMLAGETAVQIDNMPGQDTSRVLLTVHNDQFYRLTLVPASTDYGDRYTQMQDLYAQVLDSFQFLP